MGACFDPQDAIGMVAAAFDLFDLIHEFEKRDCSAVNIVNSVFCKADLTSPPK
jgi:hypothetical protein